MFHILLKATLVAVLFTGLTSFDLAPGWLIAGSKPRSYQMGVDMAMPHAGQKANTIKSTEKKINGFGTLMQNLPAEKYLNKRVRMTAYVKSQDVQAWAGLWLRVDGLDQGVVLAFDNMEDRPIKGTTDWTKYEVVLDVPIGSNRLAYGTLLSGTGQVWFDDVKFDVVDKNVALTGARNEVQPQPINMDFNTKKLATNGLPKGWFENSVDNGFAASIDTANGMDASCALHIQSIKPKSPPVEVIGQSVLAKDYVGKKVRLTGYIKTKDAKGRAYLRLSVWREEINKEPKPMIADHTYKTGAKGTMDWKKCEIVLDVPANAERIYFGGVLARKGEAWFDKFSLETVDSSVPVTKEIKKN